jgi:hypothetical protein
MPRSRTPGSRTPVTKTFTFNKHGPLTPLGYDPRFRHHLISPRFQSPSSSAASAAAASDTTTAPDAPEWEWKFVEKAIKVEYVKEYIDNSPHGPFKTEALALANSVEVTETILVYGAEHMMFQMLGKIGHGPVVYLLSDTALITLKKDVDQVKQASLLFKATQAIQNVMEARKYSLSLRHFEQQVKKYSEQYPIRGPLVAPSLAKSPVTGVSPQTLHTLNVIPFHQRERMLLFLPEKQREQVRSHLSPHLRRVA